MKLEERNTVCLEQDEHGGLGNHGLSLRMGGGGLSVRMVGNPYDLEPEENCNFARGQSILLEERGKLRSCPLHMTKGMKWQRVLLL